MSRIISLKLPNPPSANRYWRHNRGVTHLSQEALVYREMVGWEVVKNNIEPFIEKVPLVFTAVFYGLRENRDLDNCLKQTLDSLSHHCYADDNQIVEIHLRRRDSPKVKQKDGYVMVEITEAVI